MDKNKQAFIDKMHKKTKKELVGIICDLYETSYYHKKEIHQLKSLCFSHQQVLKSVLNDQQPTIVFESDEDESDEEMLLPEKESLRSYV